MNISVLQIKDFEDINNSNNSSKKQISILRHSCIITIVYLRNEYFKIFSL